MNEIPIDLTTAAAYGIPIVGLIMAIVSLAKTVGLSVKLAPILAIVLGILAAVFLVYPDNLGQGIFVGIGYGLSASGLYSGGKTLVKGGDSNGS